MIDNPNAHKPCRVREELPMEMDSTYGEAPAYRLVCKCGAVQIYGKTYGITASTGRCYRCCGVAFGLRRRESIR